MFMDTMDAVNNQMSSDTRNRQSSLPILSLFSGCLHAHYVAYLHIFENTMNAESHGFRHMPLSNCQNLHKVINDPSLFFLGSENMHELCIGKHNLIDAVWLPY